MRPTIITVTSIGRSTVTVILTVNNEVDHWLLNRDLTLIVCGRLMTFSNDSD